MEEKKERNLFQDELKISTEDLESLAGFFNDLNFDLDSLDEQVGLKAIFAAIMLPEDEFALIHEYILNELEKSLNSMDDKLLMLQAMNVSGVKVEDLEDLLQEIISTISEEMKGHFSPQKIDFLIRFMTTIMNALMDAEGIAKRIITVPIELTHEDAKLPAYAKPGDAGLDVYAVEDIGIAPGETKIIPTGIKIALPLGYEVQVRPRSGLSVKTPLRIANSPGTIDANYRGEIGVIVQNTESKIKDLEYEVELDNQGMPSGVKIKSIEFGAGYTITKGMRFAQIVLSEVPSIAFVEVDNVGEIGQSRESGFGGTGLY